MNSSIPRRAAPRRALPTTLRQAPTLLLSEQRADEGKYVLACLEPGTFRTVEMCSKRYANCP